MSRIIYGHHYVSRAQFYVHHGGMHTYGAPHEVDRRQRVFVPDPRNAACKYLKKRIVREEHVAVPRPSRRGVFIAVENGKRVRRGWTREKNVLSDGRPPAGN